MKNLAPQVERYRLLIEATYPGTVAKADVERFLRDLPAELGLRIYCDPLVYSPGGEGRAINQGYDGFVALIDSGIAIYVWESSKFVSVVVYSCKAFATEQAVAFTRRFFDTTALEYRVF